MYQSASKTGSAAAADPAVVSLSLVEQEEDLEYT